ncbi:MAG TPA: nitronate monooxygenase family protein [Deferrisomatales bacterium]|nr:nitronate monooxygenase family protein [Deferrisomatales bacterium]
MLKTRITELFGVERPIVQGGLMWVARAELVAAVAEAGGMGFLTALTFPEPEGLRAEIRRCRERTGQPFGVNLTFLPTLGTPDYGGYLDVILEEGVRFVETAGRNPEAYMGRLKAAGVRVVHKCTSVRHAVKAEAIGCDAVSIDGFEAAGHPGEDDVPGLVLVPLTRDAVRVPVIASGGIADGRGLAAALALGADGVNMGTRFVATREAPVHAHVKQALVGASERDTRLILRTLRNTERVLANRAAAAVLEIEGRGNARIEDLIPYVAGRVGKSVLERGDLDAGTLAAGQSVGLIRDVPTCRELLDRIVAEAEEVIADRLPGLVRGG